nr:uncharacterized protein CTRU02_00484 [Colletotrichum truncatum]KAF6801735.1 membrane protein [Colletotrichum truncatum]
MKQENEETTIEDEQTLTSLGPTHLPQMEEAKRRITYEANLSSAVNHEKAPSTESRPPRISSHSVRTTALAPEEVLFRRKAAPGRFAEFDVYMAHERNLPDGGRGSLPDADLLKAVHSYASHFYSTLGGQQRNASYHVGARNIDERSMDETALLAFGILIEEAGREVLGNRGDMVFTEGLDVPADANSPPEIRPSIDNGSSQSRPGNQMRVPMSVGFTDIGSWKRPSKRRKMTDPDNI